MGNDELQRQQQQEVDEIVRAFEAFKEAVNTWVKVFIDNLKEAGTYDLLVEINKARDDDNENSSL